MAKELTYKRFDFHQRIQHIGMFTSFFILTITGLPIKFEQSRVSQGVVSMFGGFDNLFNVHLAGAIIMLAVSVYHLLYLVIYPLITKKMSWATLPGLKDFSDVVYDVLHLLGLRKDRPLFDRYSYKEKFDYWAVFWGMVIMAGSGLIMWFPGFFTQYMPRWIIDSSRYAHSDEAILAISAIFIWHFYNVHFSSRVFPMSHVWYLGTLTRVEMEEEHPLELERLESAEEKQTERKTSA